jgi:2-haloacid dehalogenase
MNAVLFDLGKVLLDWNPRYFYSRFFDGDEDALERFLAEAVPGHWILEMDAGKPSAVAIAERQRLLPQHAELIGRWSEGWPQMLRGEIAGSVQILDELKRRGLRLYALTNFSTETFPIARECCEPTSRSGAYSAAEGRPRTIPTLSCTR